MIAATNRDIAVIERTARARFILPAVFYSVDQVLMSISPCSTTSEIRCNISAAVIGRPAEIGAAVDRETSERRNFPGKITVEPVSKVSTVRRDLGAKIFEESAKIPREQRELILPSPAKNDKVLIGSIRAPHVVAVLNVSRPIEYCAIFYTVGGNNRFGAIIEDPIKPGIENNFLDEPGKRRFN